MKLAQDHPRRLVAILWAISACLFLWFFNHAKPEPFTLESFFLFSFMLLGGGASYHFLAELIITPYFDKHSNLWKKLLWSMLLLMITLLLAGAFVVIDKKFWPQNGLLAYAAILFGYFGLYFMSFRVERAFKAIRANLETVNKSV